MIKRYCDRPGCNNEVDEDELSKVLPDYIPIICTYLVIRHDFCAKCMTEFVTDYWYAKEGK